jgi:hypothetical protein
VVEEGRSPVSKPQRTDRGFETVASATSSTTDIGIGTGTGTGTATFGVLCRAVRYASSVSASIS